MMKVKTDYNECEYITAGKVYDVVNDWYITNDDGIEICIVTPKPGFKTSCAHLDSKGFWEEVE